MRYVTMRQGLAALNAQYEEFAGRLKKAAEQLAEVEEKTKDARTDRALSDIGRRQRLEYLGAIHSNLRMELEAVAKEGEQAFSDVYSDIYNSFPSVRPRPCDLDRDALYLMDSGILSPSEMIELARQHSTNPTMRRIFGKKLMEYAEGRDFHLTDDQRMQMLSVGEQLSDASDAVAAVLQPYHAIYSAALRSDEDGEAGLDIQRTLYAGALERATAAADEFDAAISARAGEGKADADT